MKEEGEKINFFYIFNSLMRFLRIKPSLYARECDFVKVFKFSLLSQRHMITICTYAANNLVLTLGDYSSEFPDVIKNKYK